MSGPDGTSAALAEAFAREQHAGQHYYGTQFDFVDYHLAPGIRIIRGLGDDPADEAVFWPHDTMEDTGATRETMREYGLDDEVISGVELLTIWPGQTHQQYMDAVATEAQSIRLKFVDSKVNLDATIALWERMSAEERQICLRKYAGNLVFLERHFHRAEQSPQWGGFVVEQAARAKAILGESGNERLARSLDQGLPLPSFAS